MTKIKNPKQFKKLLVFAGLILMLFSGLQAAAAELKFNAANIEVNQGQVVPLQILLNSGEESINALEVKIQYPEDLLLLRNWSDGNSIVNLWVDKPKLQNNTLSLSGIIPGGYEGESGLILTLYFQTLKQGEGIISFLDSTQALLNDGQGTKAKLIVKNLNFRILSPGAPIEPQFQIATTTPRIDFSPPEDFKPEVARDPNLFNNKWFLVFATQDKGSGMTNYAVYETKYRKFEIKEIETAKDIIWIDAESPYLLKDQELKSYIYVKAVDKVGNQRIVKLVPQKPLAWYENYWIWIIIIVAVLVLQFAVKKIKK